MSHILANGVVPERRRIEHDRRMGEQCEVCGFEWDAVTAAEVPERLMQAAEGFGAVLRAGDPTLSQRPADETWSVVEYAAHVRDVMFNLRDRIVVGLAEDNPTPKAMFTDVRIDAGLYAGEDPQRLATEIEVGAGLLGGRSPPSTPRNWRARSSTAGHDRPPAPCCGLPPRLYTRPSTTSPTSPGRRRVGAVKVALVTGAGSGVGRAVSIALANDGFSIVLSGRRRDMLDEVADELPAGGLRHSVVQADVADPGSVDALFGVIEQEFGRVDLLFNNAGTGAPAVPIEELTLEQWQAVVDMNLTGSFLCAQRAIRS